MLLLPYLGRVEGKRRLQDLQVPPVAENQKAFVASLLGAIFNIAVEYHVAAQFQITVLAVQLLYAQADVGLRNRLLGVRLQARLYVGDAAADSHSGLC